MLYSNTATVGEGKEADVGRFLKNLLLFYVVLIEVLRLNQKEHIDNTSRSHLARELLFGSHEIFKI